MQIRTLASASIVLAGLLLAGSSRADSYLIQEVMSGLSTPRGLALGPDGGLYVAEGGSGGSGPGITLGSGNPAFLGSSGGLSRLLNGVQQRVLSNLPGVAQANGSEANGLQDIVFDGTGQAYGLFGLGASPAARNSNLGTAGAELGTLVKLSLDGSGSRPLVADLAGHELAHNPDGGNLDSNPFGLALRPGGGFLVADAGGNDVLSVSAAGDVSTLGVLAARPNPLPFGPPFFQSVPTAIAVGPDGSYYISQLTGFPFVPGAANVYRIDPSTNAMTLAHEGFTNIIDLAFDAQGDLFVLQISSNGLASTQGPGTGLLVKIAAGTGQRSVIASAGLSFPGAVLIGPDGVIYVSNHTNLPGGGQVLAITAVPEPATLTLWLAGGLLASALSRRKQTSAR